MKIAFLILIICVPVLTQTPKVLRKKYGPPVRESYLVRANILATITSAKDGQICEILIEPAPPSAMIKSNDLRLKSNVLDEVINELVPMKNRGKQLISGFLNLDCLPRNDCGGTMENYERLSIYRNGGIDSHRYATIQWKNPVCPVR